MSKSDSPEIRNIKSPRKQRGVSPKSLEGLREWLTDMPGSDLTEWERLPDIGLYMDQILTFMDRQLAFYRRDAGDKILTQPMINNYTKDGLLPRATDKKYSQGHLALISILCSLKPVLSISDLTVLFENAQIGSDEEKLYRYFLSVQQEAIQKSRSEILPDIDALIEKKAVTAEQKDADRREMALTALRLSVDARVRVMLTQKILDLLDLPPESK